MQARTTTPDLRPPERPTREIPPEVLRALIEESRSEDEQWAAEWASGEGAPADSARQEEAEDARDDVP